MKKKWLFPVGVVAAAFLVWFGVTSYGQNGVLTRQQIESPNTQANRQAIAQRVLEDTGRTGFTPQQASLVTVDYGDLQGNDRPLDAVIAVEFGPQNTVVAAYEPEGDVYRYLGDVGEFAHIRTIEFLPIESVGKEALVVREYANQDIGAFERSSFIKAYLWNNGAFREILNVPEGIEATWNTLWDGNAAEGQSRWERVEQRTDITYRDGGSPVLDLEHYQAYRVAPETADKEVPPPQDFDTIRSRMVTETYRWSDPWIRFILSEAEVAQTGERVAVIEDFASSPYALLPEFGEYINQVRIEHADGSQEVVNRNTLTGLEGGPVESTFEAYQMEHDA